MPHLILEHSANLIEKGSFNELFTDLHSLLSERLPTQLANCKSRAYEVSNYSVGDGNPINAFLHLHIKIMAGRSSELLNEIAAEILVILKDYFVESLKVLNLQISIELNELGPIYLKESDA